MVDVRYKRKLKRNITLQELKSRIELEDLTVLRRGNRLSIMPVSKSHWDFILGME
jgi:predicted RNA-binding protein with PUA-like domain